MTGRSEPDGPVALPPGEYVRPLPKGGWTLSDDAVTDIAVASGWIEDTPEARAAYLAGDDT